MKPAMVVSIDSAGRLVVPKAIREQAGLEPGMELEIRCRDGRVEIEPSPREVRLVRRGKLLVAIPKEVSEPLNEDAVRRTRDDLRRRGAGRS
jgi:AbrB family looped-hinge helix DNA binding protein